MKLKILNEKLTVCKVFSHKDVNTSSDFFFFSKTDEELSLVCPTKDTPKNTAACEDGWRAFRIEGTLDFSLIGILSEISTVLADNKIGIFAVSTYNTDYVLVKEENLEKAIFALKSSGYEIIDSH